MRQFVAAFALLAGAGPLAAGPIDTLQYRTSFRFDVPSGAGPESGARFTTYPFGNSPLFGVGAEGTSVWQDAYPAYPAADFAFLHAGSLKTYIANGPSLNASGSETYRFDVELRDDAGRVGAVSFSDTAHVTWSDGYGYTSAFRGNPPSGSLLLGDTRYDVQLSYESGLYYYWNHGGGVYNRTLLALVPTTPYPDGKYTSAFGGIFYATITPAPEPIGTPEPGTLVLAAAGLGGLLTARRLRRVA